VGIDITGWVEIKTPWSESWLPIIGHVGVLVGRNYDAFGCLFGVNNYAHFAPIAAERGLPDNLSEQLKQENEKLVRVFGPFGQGAFFLPSWVLWSELKAVDWDEEAEAADSRLHRYHRNEQGELVYETKSAWSRPFAEHTTAGEAEVRASVVESLVAPRTYTEGQEWEIDGVIYRAEKMRRRDALSEGWQMLFQLMETLAGTYGDDRVRLVVWFEA
jgi:hypothetical protein